MISYLLESPVLQQIAALAVPQSSNEEPEGSRMPCTHKCAFNCGANKEQVQSQP